MDNISFNLSDDIKEKMIDAINNICNWYKEFCKKVYNLFKNIYDNIDWIKYKRYLKYQKRIRNRVELFAKRKCRYGR